MNHRFLSAAALGVLLLSLCSASAQQAIPPVAGKVVSVAHEKVTINNVWFDKISVGVDRCDARGTIDTVTYLPATVSDRTALGHLFEEDLASAHSPNMEKQQQPNGFGVFWVDAQKHVTRTGLLGHGVSCADIPHVLAQFK